MASAVCFGLALLILTSCVVQIDSDPKRYISVVSDIHEYYRTSSVSFVLSRNNRCLEDYTAAHSLSRKFSRKYDFTSIIHFDQLDETTKWYHKRIGRSLLVVFLRSLSDIAEFTGNTKFTSEPNIWLVIFINESDSSAVCEYCSFPKENTFRLRFDTEMVVLCCDSLILKQWWSIDRDHTQVSEIAVWTDENREKIIFFDTQALDARRYDLQGAGIRIGLFWGSVYAYEVDGQIRGFFGDILNEVKRSMNFTITEIVQSPRHGISNLTMKNERGRIGWLSQGEVDLGVAEMLMTAERLKAFEFTRPLATTQNHLYIRDEGYSDGVSWIAYFQVFSPNVWISTIVLIIVAPILLAVMRVFTRSTSLPALVGESYLDVWSIVCQQGLCEFPSRTSQRIAFCSILILGLIIYGAYSASLASFLAISVSSLPFTTVEGCANDGSYRLITLRNSATYESLKKSTDPRMINIFKLMKPVTELPQTLLASLDQVCQEKVALYGPDITILTSQIKMMCKITSIPCGDQINLAMIMPGGSQYSRAINYHIQRLIDTGVMNRIRHQYYDSKYPITAVSEFKDINQWDIIPALAILTGGLILSLFLLLSEAMFNALKTNLQNRRRGKWLQKSWTSNPGNKHFPFTN